jgi:hypothetical protein
MQNFHEILIIQNINDQWRWIQMQMRDAAVKTNWGSQKKKTSSRELVLDWVLNSRYSTAVAN